MAAKRKTIDRTIIVGHANRMLAHLAKSGTHADQLRREAIIALTDSILLEGNSYNGFASMNPPAGFASFEEFYAHEERRRAMGEPAESHVWDNTRKTYY